MKKFIAAFCVITLLICTFSVNIFAEQTEEKTETDVSAEVPEENQPEEDTEGQPETTEITFEDVADDAWYKEYVDYAVSNKLFEGTDKNQFSPDMTMTRAQIVQVFANIAGVDTSDNSKESRFTDVEKDKWYTAAVIWAAENKVAEGTSDYTFEPNDPVTREQMCVMLVNYVENFLGQSFQGTSAIIPFNDDKEISEWARYSVYVCRRAELIDGTGNGSFEPKAEASRAACATIFTDFHKKYITK